MQIAMAISMKLKIAMQTGPEAPFSQGAPSWDAHVLHVNRAEQVVLFWAEPKPVWNFLGMDVDGTTKILGPVEERGRCGFLCYRKIEATHWQAFENGLPHSLPSDDHEDVQQEPPDDTALDMLTKDSKYRSLWPALARYASPHIKSSAELTSVLRAATWGDVVRAEDPTVERDATLFEALDRRIQQTKFAIVLGGRYSGLSVFLKQYRRRSNQATIPANFEPESYKKIREIFERLPHAHGNGDLDAHAVCASLALSAYVGMMTHLGPRASLLADFLDLQGSVDAVDFAYAYLPKARKSTPLDHLLQTAEKLATIASEGAAPTRVLIFLSFRRLSTWLWDPRSTRAEDIRRAMWDELNRFGGANIDHRGRLNAGSTLDGIKHAALLLELRKIDLPILLEKFCRACLIQLPPLAEREITELWRKRTQLALPKDALTELRQITGGHPFLVDAMVSTAANDRSWSRDDESGPLTSIRNAYKRLIDSLPRNGHDSGAGETTDLGDRWQRYVRWLRENLPQPTLNNEGPLLQLQDPYSAIEATSDHSDWFASGFVWLAPRGDRPLAGFAEYPEITSRTFPRLVKGIVEHLRTP